METIEKCQVCGTENIRIHHQECVGTVEDHYFCKQCGYFRHMAYSPVIEGVAIPPAMTAEEFEKIYGEIVRQKKLKIYDRSILDCL